MQSHPLRGTCLHTRQFLFTPSIQKAVKPWAIMISIITVYWYLGRSGAIGSMFTIVYVCATLNKTMNLKLSVPQARTHKNRRLEEECVTPIEAGSLVKIYWTVLKIERPACA